MGGHSPWEVSRWSHRLGIIVLGSSVEETSPPWLLGEPVGQRERQEKPGLHCEEHVGTGLPTRNTLKKEQAHGGVDADAGHRAGDG